MEEMKRFPCAQCGESELGTFVRYGSFFLECLHCSASGTATSFISIIPMLEGIYRAIDVDKDMDSTEIIFEGDIAEGIAKIRKEADKGKLIQLVKIVK